MSTEPMTTEELIEELRALELPDALVRIHTFDSAFSHRAVATVEFSEQVAVSGPSESAVRRLNVKSKTVAELIAKLVWFDQDKPVALFTSDSPFPHRLAGVRVYDGVVHLSGPKKSH